MIKESSSANKRMDNSSTPLSSLNEIGEGLGSEQLEQGFRKRIQG